jgi:hypothetical protein
MKQKQTEQVLLCLIYYHNGEITVDYTHDGEKIYELYGFLKIYLKKLEAELIEGMDDEEE